MLPTRLNSIRSWEFFAVCLFLLTLSSTGFCGVPPLLNFQGRIVIGGAAYSGPGQFQFALVDGAGANTFWSNDGTSSGGHEPTAAIPLTLTNGLYAVLLGDTSVAGMTLPLNSGVFTNADVRLRVWFNDGAHGFEQLAPDQRIAPAGYALVAGTANNFYGNISSAQLPGNLATTNFVTSLGYVTADITNGLATTAYVNALTNVSPAITWGTTTNQTAISGPAKIYFYVTNGQPVYGILNFNN